MLGRNFLTIAKFPNKLPSSPHPSRGYGKQPISSHFTPYFDPTPGPSRPPVRQNLTDRYPSYEMPETVVLMPSTAQPICDEQKISPPTLPPRPQSPDISISTSSPMVQSAGVSDPFQHPPMEQQAGVSTPLSSPPMMQQAGVSSPSPYTQLIRSDGVSVPLQYPPMAQNAILYGFPPSPTMMQPMGFPAPNYSSQIPKNPIFLLPPTTLR